MPKDLFAPTASTPKDLFVAEAEKRGLFDKPGVLDYLMMGLEPAATIATGAIAEPVAGIAGLAKTITSGPEAGAETIEQVQDAMTYEPRTESGQGAMQAIGETLHPIIEPIGEAVQAVGDVAYKAGGPVAGAGTITAIAAIPELLGLKGSRAAKKMATRRILQNTDSTDLFDSTGELVPEIKNSLQMSGIPEEEFLTFIPERLPEQSVRADLFQEVGTAPTKGELTQDAAQRTRENQLFESTMDTAAEPLRQFKLKQSNQIKRYLDNAYGPDVTIEETGQLVQDTLSGRKKLLRTQKNELYQTAAENAESVNDVAIFTDEMSNALPDQRTMDRLAILDESGSKRLNDWLTRFGVKEPSADVEFEPEILTLENFDNFRVGLNEISKSSDAIKVATGPIKKALDFEVDELAANLEKQGIPSDVIQPLKEARATVRQMRTEFSPQAMVSKLIDTKKDGFTPITDASKVYDKLAARSSSVEETRRVVNSLKKAETGDEALASLQSSVLMDLIDAGFGTESRQISGVRTFNPTTFKRRLKNLGEEKVAAIFGNNKDSFRKIRNIDKIASELIPPAGTVPKGSATVILDLANKLGMAGISTKVPGGPLLMGAMQKIAQPVKVGAEVKAALHAEPDVIKLKSLADTHYPGIAAALGISKSLQEGESEQ